MVLFVLWLGLLFVAVTTVGATVLRLLAGRVVDGVSFGLALALAIVVCLGIPWLVDWRMTIVARRLDPTATGLFVKTSIAWNLLILALFVVAIPQSTRAALVERGDWLVRGLAPPAAAPLRTGAVWLGEHIPRSSPLGATSGLSSSGPSGPSPSGDGTTAPGLAATVSNGAPVAAGEMQPQQVFERFADSVVVLHVEKQIGEGDPLSIVAGAIGIKRIHGLGSGFIVEPDGIVVTNHHVIDGATSVQMSLRDRRTFSPVEVLVLDQQNDLALVRIQAHGLPVVAIREDDLVAPGERAMALGAPLGLEYSITDGIVSAVRSIQGTNFLQMQTTIAPGSSGSPLFDNRGRVIGVNTATRQAGLNLAVAANHVRDLLRKPRVPKALARYTRGPELKGIRVEGVETSSVDRMALQDALDQLVLVVAGCAQGPVPEKANATFTYASPGLTPDIVRAWTRRPEMETNLDSKSAKCLSGNAKYGGPLLYAWLLANYETVVKEGKSVALVLDIDGFGANDKDSRGKSLELRFRVASESDGSR